MGGMRTNGRNNTPMAEINVTPLVDVMLVLLIIFMVTAPMLQEGVSVELPQAQGKALEKKPNIKELVISVSGKGEVFLNEKTVNEESLPTIIKEAVKNEPRREVYLRADKTVPYGTVVRIIGSLKAAGINNLGMITTPANQGSGEK
jgi:biopolymer transport protein TolR